MSRRRRPRWRAPRRRPAPDRQGRDPARPERAGVPDGHACPLRAPVLFLLPEGADRAARERHALRATACSPSTNRPPSRSATRCGRSGKLSRPGGRGRADGGRVERHRRVAGPPPPGGARLVPADPDAALEVRTAGPVLRQLRHDADRRRSSSTGLRPEETAIRSGSAEARELLDRAYRWLDERMAAREWAAGERSASPTAPPRRPCSTRTGSTRSASAPPCRPTCDGSGRGPHSGGAWRTPDPTGTCSRAARRRTPTDRRGPAAPPLIPKGEADERGQLRLVRARDERRRRRARLLRRAARLGGAGVPGRGTPLRDRQREGQGRGRRHGAARGREPALLDGLRRHAATSTRRLPGSRAPAARCTAARGTSPTSAGWRS